MTRPRDDGGSCVARGIDAGGFEMDCAGLRVRVWVRVAIRTSPFVFVLYKQANYLNIAIIEVNTVNETYIPFDQSNAPGIQKLLLNIIVNRDLCA